MSVVMNTQFDVQLASNDLLRDGIVEVRGDNGAFYKAFIVDVHEPGDATASSNTDPPLGSETVTPSTGPTATSLAEVTLAFENDWQPQSRFPINRIRLPPPTSFSSSTSSVTSGSPANVAPPSQVSNGQVTPSGSGDCVPSVSSSSGTSSPMFTEGMEVEVLSCTNEGEPCGWWRAVVKMSKGMLVL